MLPTGRAVDLLHVEGERAPIRATLVDAGNPLVVVRATDLGLTGAEERQELLHMPRLNGATGLLERVRAAGAVKMRADKGLGGKWVTENLRATPKIAWVAPAMSYTHGGGGVVKDSDVDLVGRVLSMGVVHQAFTGTGALAVAVAARIPGTIVAEVLGGADACKGPVRLGHNAGPMEVSLSVYVRVHGSLYVLYRFIPHVGA